MTFPGLKHTKRECLNRAKKCPTFSASSREDEDEKSSRRQPGRRRRLHIHDAQFNTLSHLQSRLQCFSDDMTAKEKCLNTIFGIHLY